jgi:N-acetylmuramoyl-L-alanine amidase
MKFWQRLRNFFSRKPTQQDSPNVSPPDAPRPSQGTQEPEVNYQRVTDLPISRGRKMKPQAILVHYTAGHKDQRARDAIAFMQKMGHGYLFLDHKGQCWQNIMLDESYAHAGVSKMPDFSQLKGRTSISAFAIGIEVACGGRVDNKNQTWFKRTIPTSEIRTADLAIHGINGRFERYTQDQEDALFQICLDLCRRFDIHPSNVVGHHEVSPGRKDDPGAALSMGMHRFRAMLADELNRK